MSQARHTKPHHIIKEPLMTEKYAPTTAGKAQQQRLAFRVARDASKTDIRQAIESLYSENGIKVDSVRTMTVKGKPRRTRQGWFRTKDWKKAVVVLTGDSSLDLV